MKYVPMAVVVLVWSWLLFGCSSPDTKPLSVDAGTDVSYQDAAVDVPISVHDAARPEPPTLFVCDDDAAGCQERDL